MKKKHKRPYRSVKVNSVRVDSLLERTQSERLLVAIDVAKEKMVAAVLDEDERVLVTVKWSHPVESEAFYDFVNRLGAERRLEVVMEPTGTYGDALRFHLRKRNVAVYQVSPKLVHDARELYDGVPSCHDAKSCGIIGMLHLNGRSRLFEGVSAARRRMKAATSTLYRYEKQFIRERCQLAAMLARFWPGLTDVLSVGTKSLLCLLSEMGSAAAVCADPDPCPADSSKGEQEGAVSRPSRGSPGQCGVRIWRSSVSGRSRRDEAAGRGCTENAGACWSRAQDSGVYGGQR